MQVLPKTVSNLIQNLERIPGLGPKSSARIALFFLKSSKEYVENLSNELKKIKSEIKSCQICNSLTDQKFCPICLDKTRNFKLLAVVEDVLDVVAFEGADLFKGVYHVLGGAISPVNGIGPSDLSIDKLIARVKKEKFDEIIIATNPNFEGEATAVYIKNLILKIDPQMKITRLARGLPTNADLEYADKSTLKGAFEGRVVM